MIKRLCNISLYTNKVQSITIYIKNKTVRDDRIIVSSNNKQNKLRQTKKNEMKEESYLNYTFFFYKKKFYKK